MRKIVFFHILFLLPVFSYAQQNKEIKKSEYVIVADDCKIVSNERLNELFEQGYVKSINKGVLEEERDRLVEKFGSRVGEKEFIVTISLYTKEEVEKVEYALN